MTGTFHTFQRQAHIFHLTYYGVILKTREIQSLMKGIKQMIDNAAEGKEVDIKAEIPEFLTSDTLLLIIEKIMKETTKHM